MKTIAACSNFCILYCVSELHSMSMKLVSSGSYNVRASEMAHLQDRQPKTVNCVVHFLDETDETFEIDVSFSSWMLRIYMCTWHCCLVCQLWILWILGMMGKKNVWFMYLWVWLPMLNWEIHWQFKIDKTQSLLQTCSPVISFSLECYRNCFIPYGSSCQKMDRCLSCCATAVQRGPKLRTHCPFQFEESSLDACACMYTACIHIDTCMHTHMHAVRHTCAHTHTHTHAHSPLHFE